jgi:hypothetical protein
MNIHVVNFYQNRSDWQVIALQDYPKAVFEEWISKAPLLPKGWWELSLLPCADRIDFVSTFWNMRFPYRPHVSKVIQQFFSCVEDLGVYLVKKHSEDCFKAHLVYSMSDEQGFYYGLLSATKEAIKGVHDVVKVRWPEDYLSLLKIHNGFAKNSDEGVLPLEKIMAEKHLMYGECVNGLYQMTFEQEPLDPECLIPFYKKDAQFYQCFHKEWYPDQEMGSLGILLSQESQRGVCLQQVFPSFLSWLTMYMGVEDV